MAPRASKKAPTKDSQKASQKEAQGGSQTSQDAAFFALAEKLCGAIDDGRKDNMVIKAPETVKALKSVVRTFRTKGFILPETAVADIVASLETIDGRLCQLMHPDMMAAVIEILLQAGSSLPAERGLALLADSMHQTSSKQDGSADFVGSNSDLSKDTWKSLLEFVVDGERGFGVRRWACLVAIYLFRCSNKIRKTFEFGPDHIRQAIGPAMLDEPNEIMKAIIGQLMLEIVTMNETEVSIFFPQGLDESLYEGFPTDTQNGRFAELFDKFIGDLEAIRRRPGRGNDLFFGSHVLLKPRIPFGLWEKQSYILLSPTTVTFMALETDSSIVQMLDVFLASITETTICTNSEDNEVWVEFGFEADNSLPCMLDAGPSRLKGLRFVIQTDEAEAFLDRLRQLYPAAPNAKTELRDDLFTYRIDSQQVNDDSVLRTARSQDAIVYHANRSPEIVANVGGESEDELAAGVPHGKTGLNVPQNEPRQSTLLEDGHDVVGSRGGEPTNIQVMDLEKNSTVQASQYNISDEDSEDDEALSSPSQRQQEQSEDSLPKPKVAKFGKRKAVSQMPVSKLNLKPDPPQDVDIAKPTVSVQKAATQPVVAAKIPRKPLAQPKAKKPLIMGTISSQPKIDNPRDSKGGPKASNQMKQSNTSQTETKKTRQSAKEATQDSSKSQSNKQNVKIADEDIVEDVPKGKTTKKSTAYDTVQNVTGKSNKAPRTSLPMKALCQESKPQKRYSLHRPVNGDGSAPANDIFDLAVSEDEEVPKKKKVAAKPKPKARNSTGAIASKSAISTANSKKKRLSAPAKVENVSTRHSQRGAAAKAMQRIHGVDDSDVEDTEEAQGSNVPNSQAITSQPVVTKSKAPITSAASQPAIGISKLLKSVAKPTSKPRSSGTAESDQVDNNKLNSDTRLPNEDEEGLVRGEIETEAVAEPSQQSIDEEVVDSLANDFESHVRDAAFNDEEVLNPDFANLTKLGPDNSVEDGAQDQLLEVQTTKVDIKITRKSASQSKTATIEMAHKLNNMLDQLASNAEMEEVPESHATINELEEILDPGFDEFIDISPGSVKEADKDMNTRIVTNGQGVTSLDDTEVRLQNQDYEAPLREPASMEIPRTEPKNAPEGLVEPATMSVQSQALAGSSAARIIKTKTTTAGAMAPPTLPAKDSLHKQNELLDDQQIRKQTIISFDARGAKNQGIRNVRQSGAAEDTTIPLPKHVPEDKIEMGETSQVDSRQDCEHSHEQVTGNSETVIDSVQVPIQLNEDGETSLEQALPEGDADDEGDDAGIRCDDVEMPQDHHITPIQYHSSPPVVDTIRLPEKSTKVLQSQQNHAHRPSSQLSMGRETGSPRPAKTLAQSSRDHSHRPSSQISRVDENGSPQAAAHIAQPDNLNKLERSLRAELQAAIEIVEEADKPFPSESFKAFGERMLADWQRESQPKAKPTAPQDSTSRLIPHKDSQNGRYRSLDNDTVVEAEREISDPFSAETRMQTPPAVHRLKKSHPTQFQDDVSHMTKAKALTFVRTPDRVAKRKPMPHVHHNARSPVDHRYKTALEYRGDPRDAFVPRRLPVMHPFTFQATLDARDGDNVQPLAKTGVSYGKSVEPKAQGSEGNAPKKRKLTTKESSSPSALTSGSTASSSHGSSSPGGSDDGVEEGMWNDALRPHYRKLFTAVHRIADAMIIQLSAEEDKMALLAQDYRTKGEKILRNHQDLRKQEITRARTKLGAKRERLVEHYEAVDAAIDDLTGDLRVKPVVAFERKWKDGQARMRKLIADGMKQSA